MTDIAEGMRYDAGQVERHCTDLLTEFAEKHRQIIDFRDQWFMRPGWDPQIGEVDDNKQMTDTNPFRGIEPFQSPVISVTGRKVISRLTENEAVIDVVAPLSTSEAENIANDTARILNRWKAQIQDRTGVHWGRAMADGQVRLSYAIMHVRRCPEVWGMIERERGDEKREGYDYDGEMGVYVENPQRWKERKAGIMANGGPAWHVEFIDPLTFACRLGRGPMGGLNMALVSFEVYADEYDEELDAEELQVLAIRNEQPAPGIEQSIGAGGQTNDTPSTTSGTSRKRIHVYQLWTKDEFYEATGTGGGFDLRKAFPHEYGEVPFYVVPADTSTEADPCWRWTPYQWPLYQIMPAANRFVMLTLGTAELTASPLYVRRQSNATRAPLLPDGTQQDMQEGTSLGQEMSAGTDIQQIQVQYSNGLVAGLDWWKELIKEMTPDTGFFELATNTQPGTARVGQSQSSVGPKNLLHQQDLALAWMGNFMLRWHRAHPDEELSAFVEGDGKKLKLLRVDAGQLQGYTVTAKTDPTSSWERFTATEHLMKLLQGVPGPDGVTMQPLITLEDFFEEGRGADDPKGEATKVLVESAIQPYRIQALKDALAAKMGSRFVAGVNGEIVGAGGAPANPYDVAASAGWKPQRPAATQAPAIPMAGAEAPMTNAAVGVGVV